MSVCLSVLITISHRLFLLRIRESFGIHSSLNWRWDAAASRDSLGGIITVSSLEGIFSYWVLWEGFFFLLDSVGGIYVLIRFSREIYRCSGLAIYVSVRREEENPYA